MSMSIPAKQTTYRGRRFRSRTEARWAVFFDALGTPWEYEKEGFDLFSGSYLPDFGLPQVNIGCWLEVKGDVPTEREKKLAQELATGTRSPVFIFSGIPDIEIFHEGKETIWFDYNKYDLKKRGWTKENLWNLYVKLVDEKGDENEKKRLKSMDFEYLVKPVGLGFFPDGDKYLDIIVSSFLFVKFVI